MREVKVTCDKCRKDCNGLDEYKRASFGEDRGWGDCVDLCNECYAKVMDDIKPFIPVAEKK